MIMPRLFALSEVQWCTPANKDFDRFSATVHDKGFKILQIKGFNYRDKGDF